MIILRLVCCVNTAPVVELCFACACVQSVPTEVHLIGFKYLKNTPN